MQITEMLLTNPTARPGTKIVPKGLVIHWTANERKGADAVANRNYFNKPTTEASAHYIVDDWQIVRCLPEIEMGYHVGAKSYKSGYRRSGNRAFFICKFPGCLNENKRSCLGGELVGRRRLWPTDEAGGNDE